MENVEAVAELTKQIRNYCGAEGTIAERFAELLKAAPDCAFRNYFSPGHLTGSAWIVDQTGQRVLLLHHGKLHRWLQPGGHADGEFDLTRVALRETQEESGLTRLRLVQFEIFDLDIHEIPPRGAEPAHLHFDVRYLILADSAERLVLSDESHAVEWVELARLSEYTTEPSVLRMARKCELLIQKSPQLLNF
jgi:8-oxo-dGTP pyrophosphatase MutT (NUDIX family)